MSSYRYQYFYKERNTLDNFNFTISGLFVWIPLGFYIYNFLSLKFKSEETCLSIPERKLSRMPCFLGNLVQRALMACTTTILNSSEISETKLAICFISRSTLDSAPVFSRVVMARVAMDRFESVVNRRMLVVFQINSKEKFAFSCPRFMNKLSG